MRYLLTALYLLPTLVLGQELHTFKNGEVADAEKINETHQYILNNASGGCSATQQDNSVLIECADGTSGVIAGAGTVVMYPEGQIGEVDPLSYDDGEIVVIDFNGVTVAKAIVDGNFAFENSILVELTAFQQKIRAILHNDESVAASRLMAFAQGGDDAQQPTALFMNEDCTGPVWIASRYLADSFVASAAGQFWVADLAAPQEQLVFSSRLRSVIIVYWGDIRERGSCESGNWAYSARRGAEYTAAPEILNAAYPVRLKQLP